MAKTLVTGAAGFIGSHVVRLLLEQGRDVKAFVFRGEDTRSLDGLEVERVEGDVRDRDSIERALTGCDRLYHLAAIYALWLPDRRVMFDVNVTGTQNMLWAATKAGLERVIYTSSIAAVGVLPGNAAANEQTEFNMTGKCNDYIFSKWLSHVVADGFARQGLPLTIVQPAFPFGARDRGPTPTGQILVDLLNKKLPGYFDAGFNVVDVNDVAEGHVLAEEKGRVGESYLLANENIAFKEFLELTGRVTDTKVKLRKLPKRALIKLGYLLESRADRIKKKPLVTGSALEYGAHNLYYDNTKARTELGLEFTPIEDSIRRSVAWFRENGYVKR